MLSEVITGVVFQLMLIPDGLIDRTLKNSGLELNNSLRLNCRSPAVWRICSTGNHAPMIGAMICRGDWK